MSDPTAIVIDTDPLTQRMKGRTVHRNLFFDVPYISQIKDNLYQGGCENGLILPTNIEHLVSLYPWERYTITHAISSMLTVTMYDSEDQAFDQVDAIARWVRDCCKDGPTLVHCQAGLNRSSLVAARVLIMEGMGPKAAIRKLRESRSTACLCNATFENWILGQTAGE